MLNYPSPKASYDEMDEKFAYALIDLAQGGVGEYPWDKVNWENLK